MPSETKKSRHIPPDVRLHLWNSAAGTCQYPGCNKFLWRNGLTLDTGNFGEMAHIIGVNGPRSNEQSAKLSQDFENLLLLCPECHKLIDTNVEDHPEELLRQWKKSSEGRIGMLLGMRENQKRKVLIFRTAVSKENMPIIGKAEYSEALRENGNYPATPYPEDINFTTLMYEDLNWENMGTQLSSKMAIFRKDIDQDEDMRNGIAVFAIGVISLLIKLGAELPYTIPVDIYQKSRITRKWTTRSDSDSMTVRPILTKLRDGEVGTKDSVAIISLSGTIDYSKLSKDIDPSWSIYSVSLPDGVPGTSYGPHFMKNFITLWLRMQRAITDECGTDSVMHIFAAVPSSIAVRMGQNRLSGVSPMLKLYEFNKDTKQFFYTLTLH